MVSLSNVIRVTRSIVLYPLEGGILKFSFKRSDAHRFQVQVVRILYMFNQSSIPSAVESVQYLVQNCICLVKI